MSKNRNLEQQETVETVGALATGVGVVALAGLLAEGILKEVVGLPIPDEVIIGTFAVAAGSGLSGLVLLGRPNSNHQVQSEDHLN